MQRLSLIHECKLIIQIKIFCVMIKVIEIQPSSPSLVYKTHVEHQIQFIFSEKEKHKP